MNSRAEDGYLGIGAAGTDSAYAGEASEQLVEGIGCANPEAEAFGEGVGIFREGAFFVGEAEAFVGGGKELPTVVGPEPTGAAIIAFGEGFFEPRL